MWVLIGRTASWVFLALAGYFTLFGLAILGLDAAIDQPSPDGALGTLLVVNFVPALAFALLSLGILLRVRRLERKRGTSADPSREQVYGVFLLLSASGFLLTVGLSTLEAFHEPPFLVAHVTNGFGVSLMFTSLAWLLASRLRVPPGVYAKRDQFKRMAAVAICYVLGYSLIIVIVHDELGWSSRQISRLSTFALLAPFFAWQALEGWCLLRVGRISLPPDEEDGELQQNT